MTFEEARDLLLATRKAWYAGDGTKAEMKSAAKETATIYNKKAREVASRLQSKPQLTTPEKIMRNIDRAIR